MARSTRRQRFITATALVTLTLAVSVPAGVAGASSFRPSAPRSVHASAATNSARVSWSSPASTGRSAVKRYVATSHPSNRSCTTAARTCVVRGLTAGSSYTFTVVAKNASGASPSSRASNKVTLSLTIATAGVAFLSASSTFETALNAALTAVQALTANSTQAQVTAAVNSLRASFTGFTSTLSKEKWPAAVQADMLALVTNLSAFGTDYVNLLNATSVSSAALTSDTLEADGNKEVVGDAKVRADLNLPQLITGPVASTSAMVAVGLPQTVHDFFGDAMSVTVTQIVDPATAGTGSGLPDAGYRFVAVEATLSNATGNVGGNANLAMTVVGSDGATYTADFGTAAECTNFTYGSFEVPPGDTSMGCVLYQLPTGVTVKTVQFSLDAGFLDTVAWT